MFLRHRKEEFGENKKMKKTFFISSILIAGLLFLPAFVFASPGIENLTTYTEQDTGNFISETATRVTGVNVPGQNYDVLLYYDKGVNYFDVLNINFEIYMNDMGIYSNGLGGIAISNTLEDISNLADTDIMAIGEDVGGANVGMIFLVRGSAWSSYDFFTGSVETLYYCTLIREAGNDTIILKIYSDATRTTLLDTLSVTGIGTTKYRYSVAFLNNNNGTPSRIWSGYIQNIDLNPQVVVPPPFILLPENSVTSTTGLIGDLFNAIGPFIWLFIGIPLAFVVIQRIIKIMPKEEKEKTPKEKTEKEKFWEREEKEFKKVTKYAEERKGEKIGEWLEGWRKGKISK